MTYLITFLEGVITFVSPCLLPMLPIYIAYFAGGVRETSEGVAGHNVPTSLQHTLFSATGFVLGFSTVFVLMGAFAATIGGFLSLHQKVLNLVCGAIVIFFGLHFTGVFSIPTLQKTRRLSTNKPPRGFFTSLLFGIIFALGWTPCVGAFLGSALALAASTGSTLQGVVLLICYSLGLGIPFMLSALLIEQLESAFRWVKKHYRIINTVCGVLLVVVGIFIASGQMGKWLALLAR